VATGSRVANVLGGLALVAIAAGVAFVGLTARDAPPGAGGGAPAAFVAGTAGARLEEYVTGDAAGERLERATWAKYKLMVVWPNEPAWDEAYVIRSQRIAMNPALPGAVIKAEGEVTYDTLGVLNLNTFDYETSPTRQTVPFSLLLLENTWKIGVPMLRPHPLADPTLAYLRRMREHYVTRRPAIDAAIKAIARDAAAPAP